MSKRASINYVFIYCYYYCTIYKQNAICIMHQSTFELSAILKKEVYPVKEEKRTNCLY